MPPRVELASRTPPARVPGLERGRPSSRRDRTAPEPVARAQVPPRVEQPDLQEVEAWRMLRDQEQTRELLPVPVRTQKRSNHPPRELLPVPVRTQKRSNHPPRAPVRARPRLPSFRRDPKPPAEAAAEAPPPASQNLRAQTDR